MFVFVVLLHTLHSLILSLPSPSDVSIEANGVVIDANDLVSISGSGVEIDADDEITIDAFAITIDADTVDIEADDDGDITITAGGDITLDAGNNVAIKKDAAFTVDGTAVNVP